MGSDCNRATPERTRRNWASRADRAALLEECRLFAEESGRFPRHMAPKGTRERRLSVALAYGLSKGLFTVDEENAMKKMGRKTRRKRKTADAETFRGIIRSYYESREGEECFFDDERGMVVVAKTGEGRCSVFESARDCFEGAVKPGIEESRDYARPFDFSAFSQEQLSFMAESYLGSELAEQIRAYLETHVG